MPEKEFHMYFGRFLVFGISEDIFFHITQTLPCNILQYFTAVKMINFHMKNCDICLVFAQNIDLGYTLEPPHRGGSIKYPQSMF